MITKAEVKKKTKEIVGRDPSQKNPGKEGCVYTTRKNEHCIAGQVIAEFGGQLHRAGSRANKKRIYSLVNDGFKLGIELTDGALLLLQEYQDNADIPRTLWKDAITGNV